MTGCADQIQLRVWRGDTIVWQHATVRINDLYMMNESDYAGKLADTFNFSK